MKYRKIRFLCKASAAQDRISASTEAFNNTVIETFKTQFAKQSAILDSLNTAWKPILAAGANQYGFSKERDTALRTQASEGTAKSYADATKAVGERMAAMGGGNVLIPSGAQASELASISGAAAESESKKQLAITEAGYEVGRENYIAASNALSGVATTINPQSYGDLSGRIGSEAFQQATQIYNQGDVTGLIGGILGGGIQAFAGGFGGGMGAKAGKSLFG